MNWFIILFFIISVILFFITKHYLVKNELKNKQITEEIEAFEIDQNRTTTEQLKVYHNITLKFLDENSASELVKKDGEYIQGMNQPNLIARNCLSIHDLYEKYKNGFEKITPEEKETINEFILSLLTDISKFSAPYYRYICKWLNDISIAKAKNWLEAGMPHTLEKTIVMDANWFINPRTTTLVHEMIHIHQREIGFDFEDLYKELGYYYYPEYIKGMTDIYPLNRNNPDGLSKYWLWKLPKESKSNTMNNTMNNYWWIGAIFKSITPNSLNDVNLVALKLDSDNEGNFYYLKQHPTFLNKWQSFITFFGDNPNNYHPNEMTAKFAEYYLLDILNDKTRDFDNYEGYKIYKKYFENMIKKYY